MKRYYTLLLICLLIGSIFTSACSFHVIDPQQPPTMVLLNPKVEKEVTLSVLQEKKDFLDQILLVRRIEIPQVFDSSQLIIRSKQYLRAVPGFQWAETPSSQIRNLIISTMNDSRIFRSALPSESGVAGNIEIGITLSDFSLNEDGHVVLEGDIHLFRTATRELISTVSFHLDQDKKNSVPETYQEAILQIQQQVVQFFKNVELMSSINVQTE